MFFSAFFVKFKIKYCLKSVNKKSCHFTYNVNKSLLFIYLFAYNIFVFQLI